MSILISALALAASAQAAPPASAPAHDQAQHQQMSQKHDACPCCDNMAGAKKMACCEHDGRARSIRDAWSDQSIDPNRATSPPWEPPPRHSTGCFPLHLLFTAAPYVPSPDAHTSRRWKVRIASPRTTTT